MGLFSGITDLFSGIGKAASGILSAPVIGTAIGAATGMPWLGTALNAGANFLGDNAAAIGGGAASYYGTLQTNAANQRMSEATSAFNLEAAREATAATEGMHARGISATEGMASSALSQARSQFDSSQAFNERMSNTAYTRGVADLRSAGLNPILAATRGGASSPSVSGGPTASGSGSAGSGTSAAGTQIAKINAIMPAAQAASAISVQRQASVGQRLANQARSKYGKGEAADFIETLDKAGGDMVPALISKHFGGVAKMFKKSPNARPTIGRAKLKPPSKGKRGRMPNSKKTIPLKSKPWYETNSNDWIKALRKRLK